MYGIFNTHISAGKVSSAMMKRNIVLAVSESILTGISFYFGFLLANITGLSRTYISSAELTLMSLGTAFSYAFIFVFRKNHQAIPDRFSRFTATELLKNISYSYLMHLAILFMVKDSGFSAIRNAVALAYILGLAGIMAGRFVLLHFPVIVMAREGKKRLIIKGAENRERILSKNRIPDFIPENRKDHVSQNRMGVEVRTKDVHVT
jgi:hypothetical protein